MRADGHSIKEIADRFMIGMSTASKWCHGVECPVQHGVGRGARVRAIREIKLAAMRRLACRMRAAGLTTAQICRALCLSRSTVNKYTRGVERGATISPEFARSRFVRVPLSVGDIERLHPFLKKFNAKLVYSGIPRDQREAALRAEADRLGLLESAEMRSWR
jgi:DNA-binding CsgD family transcriptional regulator